MANLLLSNLLVYRWRYIVGYSLIGLVLIATLLLAGLYVPGGLTENEMRSAVISGSLNFSDPTSFAIVNLPYYLLQHASIALFGLSIFSIKLPSVILGFISAICMLLLLRLWFKHNVALLASVLTVTTGQFLQVAQSGTPSIMYIFWSVWILLAATMVSRRMRFLTYWKLLLFISIALSLYTPLSAYVIVTLLVATILHPHLRYIVKRLSKVKLTIIGFVSLITLVPLGWAIYKDPTISLTLLGIPESAPDIKANIITLLQQYLNFVSPESGRLMLPLFGFSSLALIVLGIFRLATSRYTARSYTITVWLVLLLPILLINPTYTTVTFLPLLLLMAMGVEALIREWYKLFPKNPYARFTGLIPLSLLMIALVFSGLDRYFYGYHYDPNSSALYSRDIRYVTAELNRKDTKTPILVVEESQKDFYSLLSKYPTRGSAKVVLVTTTLPSAATTGSSTLLVNKNSGQVDANGLPTRIITSPSRGNADRWYVYNGANTVQ